MFGSRGSLTFDFFIRPEQLRLIRNRDSEPELFITQIPGQGYTFEAQEVMRCLRSGDLESPLVPWASTLGTMRTLDRWLAAVTAGRG